MSNIKPKWIYIGIITISIFFMLLIVAFFSKKVKYIDQETEHQIKRYREVIRLYKNLEKCKEGKKSFDNDLLFLTKIFKKEGLKDKILNIRSDTESTLDTVKIKFSRLNLSEVLKIFKIIYSYDNLDVKQFFLKKNFTNKKLVDLDLYVRKTK